MTKTPIQREDFGNRLSNALFSGIAEQRVIAQKLYAQTKNLPIISPHGHVDPRFLAENKPFNNPAELFIFFDHYITRILHAAGFDLSEIGKGKTDLATAHSAWKILCDSWHLFTGTNSGYWLTHTLAHEFDIQVPLNEMSADESYRIIESKLNTPEMLPRALFAKFKISFLATTDDPIDDLRFHSALRNDSTFTGRVVPTFRPDKYIDSTNPHWSENVRALLSKTGKSLSYLNYISSFEELRKFFIQNGAISVDLGVREPFTHILTAEEAEEIFNVGISGTLTAEQARNFLGHMIVEMARMSCDDGLVITLHAGVFRNHSSSTLKEFGPDTGHDLPLQCEFVNNLRPLLEKYGHNKNLSLILFSLDEASWNRDVAPLATFYPTVFIGAPWWFLDAPDAAARFRSKTTDIAGFYRGSGFIDDTRAFLSIPARHDMSRRIDANYLAGLVVEGRISITEAERVAVDLVTTIPSKAFKL